MASHFKRVRVTPKSRPGPKHGSLNETQLSSLRSRFTEFESTVPPLNQPNARPTFLQNTLQVVYTVLVGNGEEQIKSTLDLCPKLQLAAMTVCVVLMISCAFAYWKSQSFASMCYTIVVSYVVGDFFGFSHQLLRCNRGFKYGMWLTVLVSVYASFHCFKT